MSTPGLSTYRQWREVGFQLAADLHQIARMADEQGRDQIAAQARELRGRVIEHRFTLAVVGEFKRGKSTFINALLGREVLPSDVIPTTATVNRVTYGLSPIVTLHFRDGRPPKVVPVDELAVHVTKLTAESSAAAASIREAVVQYPLRFCRNDVDLVDTPGLGDEATMTAVTMELLPQADAAVLVVLSTSPLSETEGRFVEQLLTEGLSRLLVVVSAMDRIRRPADRERVLGTIRARLADRVRAHAEDRFKEDAAGREAFLKRFGQIPVYGLSPLLALEGRADGDAKCVEDSGMEAFEAELEAFLTTADQLSAERRLGQVETLCAEMLALASGGGHDSPASDRAVALDRADALLQVLEPRLERARRWGEDLPSVLRAAVEHAVGGLPLHLQRAGESCLNLDKAGVADVFPDGYDEYASEVAQRLHAAMAWAADDLMSAARESAGSALGEAAGRARADAEAAHVLIDHAESLLPETHRLRAQRSHASLGGDSDGAAGAPVRVGSALVPSLSALQEALTAPTLRTALGRYVRKSDFDRFLSLDFSGLPGQWKKQAAIQLGRCIDAVVQDPGTLETAKAALEADLKRSLAPLERSLARLHAVRLELHAARDRLHIVDEHRRSRFTADQDEVAAIAARTAKARALLG